MCNKSYNIATQLFEWETVIYSTECFLKVQKYTHCTLSIIYYVYNKNDQVHKGWMVITKSKLKFVEYLVLINYALNDLKNTDNK